MTNPVGLLPIALGVPLVVWAEKVSRLEEQIDAIGSTRSLSEVEPADWKVTLNRAIGLVVILLGVVILFAGT